MRAGTLSLIVLGALALAAGTAAAAPPDDITIYCRSTFPATQAQVRCLFTERTAQERATRARASIAPDAWVRCAGGSGSWAAMEGCLAQAATSGAGTTAVGGAPARSAEQERGEGHAGQDGDTAPATTAVAPGAADGGPPPGASAPSPSTIILGPRGTAASAAEPARPTRPVTEAEAERHLKGVLERSGEPTARCTKRQYSGGWVTVCE
jgi:hypothetical protein